MTVVINGTTGITFPDSSQQYNSYYNFKNRIINGAMVIDQRNAGASVSTGTSTNIYTVDRWQAIYAATSKYTVQRNAGSVTPPANFVNYLGVTSSSAYTPGASEYFAVRQMIEGFNVADLNWGSANAATVTLSFWVRSSLTGTFGGAIVNGASAGGENRSYPFSYTISSANTWTQISLTIPGDTTGTWATDNTGGIQVRFGLGAGSSFVGTSGSWQAGNFIQPTGTVSVVGTNGATFYVTGVQLEKGTQATSFDYRPYGTELALCQRYYYKIGPGFGNDINLPLNGFAGNTTVALLTIPFLVSMRAAPTALEQSGTAADYAIRYAGGTVANCSAVPTFVSGNVFGSQVLLTVASGLTAGGTISGRTGTATGNNAYFGFPAEL